MIITKQVIPWLPDRDPRLEKSIMTTYARMCQARHKAELFRDKKHTRRCNTCKKRFPQETMHKRTYHAGKKQYWLCSRCN